MSQVGINALVDSIVNRRNAPSGGAASGVGSRVDAIVARRKAPATPAMSWRRPVGPAPVTKAVADIDREIAALESNPPRDNVPDDADADWRRQLDALQNRRQFVLENPESVTPMVFDAPDSPPVESQTWAESAARSFGAGLEEPAELPAVSEILAGGPVSLGAANRFAYGNAERANSPVSKGTAALNAAIPGGAGSVLRLFKDDPGAALQGSIDVTARSFGSTGASLVAALLAGPLAPVVVGLGSASAEAINELGNALIEENIDPRDGAAVQRAMNDPVIGSRIRKRVLIKAGVVGAADAATAKVASLIPGGKTPLRKAGAALAGLGIEMAGGSGGEALSQAASGQDLQTGDILMEGIGELLPGAATLGSMSLARPTREGAPPTQSRNTVPRQTPGTAPSQGTQSAPSTPGVPVEDYAKLSALERFAIDRLRGRNADPSDAAAVGPEAIAAINARVAAMSADERAALLRQVGIVGPDAGDGGGAAQATTPPNGGSTLDELLAIDPAEQALIDADPTTLTTEGRVRQAEATERAVRRRAEATTNNPRFQEEEAWKAEMLRRAGEGQDGRGDRRGDSDEGGVMASGLGGPKPGGVPGIGPMDQPEAARGVEPGVGGVVAGQGAAAVDQPGNVGGGQPDAEVANWFGMSEQQIREDLNDRITNHMQSGQTREEAFKSAQNELESAAMALLGQDGAVLEDEYGDRYQVEHKSSTRGGPKDQWSLSQLTQDGKPIENPNERPWIGPKDAKLRARRLRRVSPKQSGSVQPLGTGQDYDTPEALRNVGIGREYAGRRVAASMSVRGEPTSDLRALQAAEDYRSRGLDVLVRRDGEGFGYVIGVEPQRPGAVSAAPKTKETTNEEGQEKGRQERLLTNQASAAPQAAPVVSPPPAPGAASAAPASLPDLDAMTHDQLREYAKSVGVPPRGSPEGIRARIRKAMVDRAAPAAQAAPVKASTPEYAALPTKAHEAFEAAYAARDVERLSEYLDPRNRVLRAEFAARAGLERMPPGIKRTRAAVEAWAASSQSPPATSGPSAPSESLPATQRTSAESQSQSPSREVEKSKTEDRPSKSEASQSRAQQSRGIDTASPKSTPEPWEMRAAQWAQMEEDKSLYRSGSVFGIAMQLHRGHVERAIDAGKLVPSSVLAQYPDLAEKHGKKPEAAEPPKSNIQKAREKAQAQREAKVLDTQVNTREYGVVTRRDLVDREMADGYTPETVEVTDTAAVKKAEDTKAQMDKRGNVPLGNPNHPETIRYRELQKTLMSPPKVPEYRMNKGDRHRVLTKIEYDYAAGRQAKIDAARSASQEAFDSRVEYPGVLIEDVPADEREAERARRREAQGAAVRAASHVMGGPMMPSDTKPNPYAADIAKLTPLLDKVLNSKDIPRKQAVDVGIVLNGEAPKVQEALAARLWEKSPEVAEYVVKDGPIGVRSVVQKARPAIETRAGLGLRQNSAGKWAWFEGDSQKTGAYATADEARQSPEIEAIESNRKRSEEQPAATSIKSHPEYARLHRMYGASSREQIQAKIDQMTAEIAGHAKVAQREFTGQGTRRTGAAVSAQAVRDIGNEKLLSTAYMNERFPAKPATPGVVQIDASTVKAGDEVLLERQDTMAGEPTEYAPARVEGVKVMFGEPHVKFVRGEKWRKASELRMFRRDAEAPATPKVASATPDVAPKEAPKPSGFLSNLSAADQARAEELRQKLAKKLAQQRSTLSMNAGGFDPEMLSLGAEYASLHIKAGAKRFAVFAREMVTNLGDGIRPYLKALYSAARQMPGVDKAGTDSGDYVDGLTDADIDAMVGGKAGGETPSETASGGVQSEEDGPLRSAAPHFKPLSAAVTPAGALSAGARTKAASGVYFFQGDPQNIRFAAYVNMPGEDQTEKDAARKRLAKTIAVQKAGWKLVNMRAGQYGTVWTFQKDGTILTNAGFEAVGSEVGARPQTTPTKPGEYFGPRMEEYARAFVEWLNTLPSGEDSSAATISRAIAHSGNISTWVNLRQNENRGHNLEFMDEKGERDLQLVADTVGEVIAQARRVAEMGYDKGIRAEDVPGRRKNPTPPSVPQPMTATDAERIDFEDGTHILRHSLSDGTFVDEVPGDKNTPATFERWRKAGPGREGLGQYLTLEEATRAANTRTTKTATADTEATRNSPEAISGGSITPGSEPMTLAEYPKVRDRIMSGQQTAEEHKELARWLVRSEAAIKAELDSRTLKQLAPNGVRSGTTKAEVVSTIYRNMLGRFHLGDSVSYNPFSKETYESALIKAIEATTDADIAAFTEKRQRAVDARKKALENPETLEEFRQFIAKHGESALTIDQRKRLDSLQAEVDRRIRGDDRPDYIAKVDTGNVAMTIKEGFHSKANIPLWIVQLSGRVPSETYTALNAAAKKLGGWWSSFKKDSTGFQFKTKEAAEEFVKVNQQGITTAKTDAIREEDSAQRAAERLAEMAEAQEDAANESLGRDRNTNTVRRARMAEGAEADARKAKQLAQTLANIAEGIKDGSVKALRGLRNMTQLSALEQVLMIARREYWYGLPEESRSQLARNGQNEWWNLPIDENIIAKATMPKVELNRSNVQDLAQKGLTTPGIKREAAKIDKLWRYAARRNPDGRGVTIDNPYDFSAMRAVASRLKQAGQVKHEAERVHESLMHHQRIADMGLRSDAEVRVALREYMGLRAGQIKPDRIREMERGLIGKTVGIDFFPTPPTLATEIVEKADIEPGMKVLEPSAGNGRIADAIKAAGVEPDVAEVSGDLREILAAKGHALAGRDFMEFDPGPVYDRIVMNPPFSNRQDVEHVRHAYDLLKPGGRIVAIMSEGPFFGQDKKASEFRDWLDTVGTSEQLPEGSFESDKSGLPTTGVNARVVVIDKPQVGEKVQTPQEAPAVKSTPADPVRENPSAPAPPGAMSPEQFTAALQENIRLLQEARSAFYRDSSNNKTKSRDERNRLEREADAKMPEIAAAVEAAIGEYPGDIPSEKPTMPAAGTPEVAEVFRKYDGVQADMEELWAQERELDREVDSKKSGSKVREAAEKRRDKLRETIREADGEWKAARARMIRMRQEHAYFGADPWRKLGVLQSWYPGKYSEVAAYLTKAADHIIAQIAPQLTADARDAAAREAVSRFLESPLVEPLTARIDGTLYVHTKKANQAAAIKRVNEASPLQSNERSKYVREIEQTDKPEEMDRIAKEAEALAKERDELESRAAEIQREADEKQRATNTAALTNPEKMRVPSAKQSLGSIGLAAGAEVNGGQSLVVFTRNIDPKEREKFERLPEDPTVYAKLGDNPGEKIAKLSKDMAAKADKPITILGALSVEGEPMVLFTVGDSGDVMGLNGKRWAYANSLAKGGEWRAEGPNSAVVLFSGTHHVAILMPIASSHTPQVNTSEAAQRAGNGWKGDAQVPKTYLTPKNPAPSDTIDESAFPTLEDLGIKTTNADLTKKAEDATRAYHAALEEASNVEKKARAGLSDEAIRARALESTHRQEPSDFQMWSATEKLLSKNPALRSAKAAVEAASAAMKKAETAVATERARAQSAFAGEAEQKYREALANKKWWQLDNEAAALERLWPQDPRVPVLRDMSSAAGASYVIDTAGEILPPDYKPGVGVGNVSEKRVDYTTDRPSALGIDTKAIAERARARGVADWTLQMMSGPADHANKEAAWLAGDRIKSLEAIARVAKEAPEFRADPVLTAADGATRLVWESGNERFAFVNPWHNSVAEPGPIADGQTVRIDPDTIGDIKKRVWVRPVKDTVTVAGTASSKKALTLLEKLEKGAADAANRIKKRGIQNRGRTSGATTLFDDSIDLAAVVAFRATAAGIKAGQKLTKLVSATVASLRASGFIASGKIIDEAQVRKFASAMLRDAADSGTAIEDAYAAAREANERKRTRAVGKAVGDMKGVQKAVADAIRTGRPEVVKPVADRERTFLREVERGPMREASARQAGEDAGFVAGLNAGKQVGQQTGEQKAGARAVRAILSERRRAYTAAMNQAATTIPGLIRQAREAFRRGKQIAGVEARSAQDAAAAKAAVVDGLRRQVVELAGSLPGQLRGRYLKAATSVKTMTNVVSVLNRMRRDLAKSDGRRYMRVVERLAVGLPKLEQSRRYESRKALTAARAAFGTIRRAGASADELARAASDIKAAYAEMKKHALEQRDEDKVRMVGRALKASDMREEMKGALSKKRPLPIGDVPGERDPGRIVLWLRKYANVRTLSYMLDNDYNGNGPFHRIYRSMERGLERALAMQHSFQDGMEAIVRRRGYKDLGEFLARVSGTLGSAAQETIDIKIGDTPRITLGQAMYIYALDPSTREKAHAGQLFTFGDDPDGPKFRLTDELFNKVEAALTDEQKRLVDEIKTSYDRTFFDSLSEVNKLLNGVYLDKVAGYWGVKRAMKQSDNPDVGKGWEQLVVRALHNAAMLQERVGGSAPIVIGDFGVDVIRRSESAATIVHKADLVRTLGKTVLSPEIREQINARWGKSTIDRIERVIIEYAGNKLPAIDQGIRGLASNVARAKTQLNPGTWLRNISSVFMLQAVMRYRTVLNGMSGMFNVSAYRELMKYSPRLRERWSGSAGQISYMVHGATSHGTTGALDAGKATMRQIMSAGKALSQMRGLEFRRRLADVSRPWKELLDAMTIGNLFDAAGATVAYKGYLAEAPGRLDSEGKKRWAARRATAAFFQTANTNDLLNATALQEDARTSTITALMLSFTSDIAKKQNVLWVAQKRGVSATARATAAISTSMAWSVLVAYAMAAALGGDDDDRKKAVTDRAMDEAITTIPGGTMVRKAMNWRGSSGVLDTPLGDVLTQIVSSVSRASDGMSRGDADRMRDGLFRLGQSASDMVGAPFGIWAGMVRKAFRQWGR